MRINTQRGIAPIAAIIIALLVIGGGSYAVKKGVEKRAEKKEKERKETMVKAEEEKVKEEAARTIQVKLNEQNASGQSGQAVITQIGTSTLKVIVNITGKPSTVPQPAHIHVGACPNPGAVKYPLKAVEKGAAQTELAMTLDQLLSELPLAVNVHKSAAEVKVYAACGNIEKKETGAMMEKDDAMMQKNGDAMMKKGEKMMETEGDGMMKETGQSMMKKETAVTYGSQGFSPKTITIKKGGTITFENKTGKPASVASDVHPTHELYAEFDQWKTDQRGKNEFRFTFEKVGTWNYHDHLNASQGGTIVVTE